MRFEDRHHEAEQRFSLGLETDSGRPYLAIPVSTGIVDYQEHYALTPQEYDLVAACRRREHDDLLMQRPGWNRGTPT
jgi:hypothetical protein